MASATTSPPVAWSQPYAHYPHVILLNGKYYELACTSCGGNSRGDPPFAFYKAPKSFVKHIKTIHAQPDDLPFTINDWLSNGTHHQLSDAEVELIEAGEADTLIQNKIAVKKHGERAKVHRFKGGKKRETVILANYPTVAQKEDGTYITLACCYCEGGGNARGVRGSNPSQNIRQVFMQGVQGLMNHMIQAHKLQEHSGKVEWLLEHCGTPITEERFKELKSDMSGTLIKKVEASVEVEGRQETGKKEALAKEAKENGKKVKVDKEYLAKSTLPTGARQVIPRHEVNIVNGERGCQSARSAPPSTPPVTAIQGAIPRLEAELFKDENGKVLSEAEVWFRKANGYFPFGIRYFFG
ncbi:hypothetical protein LTR85_008680 [Meristemomyces frigidus]|nr:hypothetical protein LTR85_008680 [Meristemomyces frigidus]